MESWETCVSLRLFQSDLKNFLATTDVFFCFILALSLDVLGFLAVFPRKYLYWGGGEGLGIFDLLLSVHNPS